MQDIAILKVAIKFFDKYQAVWSKDFTGGFKTTMVYVKSQTPGEEEFKRTNHALQMKELNEYLQKKLAALASEDKKLKSDKEQLPLNKSKTLS